MKKFKLIASMIAVSSLMVVTGLAFTGKNAEAAQCKVTADVPKIGTKIDKDRKWTQKDGRAYIVAVVEGKGCKMPVSVASWKAPAADGRPFREQVFFKGHSKVLDEGRHLMSVDKPECFFQVDLVHGSDPQGGNRGPNYGKLFIAGAIGGNKKCAMPTAACEELKVVKLGRTAFRFNATATLQNGAGLRAYVFTVKRGNTVVTTKTVRTNDTKASFAYQQTKPGNYTVSVKVLTSEGDKTSPACNGNFTVKAPNPDMIEVCEIETGKIVEIKQSQMSDKYTTDLSKCVPGITTDTPETPEALPNTGVGAVAAIFTGVTSLSSAAYYFISRRFL